MSLRTFLEKAKSEGQLVTISEEINPYLETARVMNELEGRLLLFERVKGSQYPVIAGVCASRENFALGLGIEERELLFTLVKALDNPVPPALVERAPCQEVVGDEIDLSRLPILTHLSGDGGAYVTAGVAVIKDADYGRNASYHRLMRIGPREFVARLIEGRGTHTAWEKSQGDLEIAICIGNSIPVLLAAAMSPPKGVDELSIANTLAPTPLVKCLTVDLEVPAEAEMILEGRVTHRLVPEGPFPDLTGTMDAIIRQQPVIEIDCITRRRDAIYQALLPGGREHRLLMGLPREPTIYAEVSKVCRCMDVFITPGGCSWLHAVVQIEKRNPLDGGRAIEAAFRGHSSLKHVVVVDEDVDIRDPAQVEWAIATRFQAGHDLYVFADQPGSSLDPSARHIAGERSRTSKMGLDATIPWLSPSGMPRTAEELATFKKVSYGEGRT